MIGLHSRPLVASTHHHSSRPKRNLDTRSRADLKRSSALIAVSRDPTRANRRCFGHPARSATPTSSARLGSPPTQLPSRLIRKSFGSALTSSTPLAIDWAERRSFRRQHVHQRLQQRRHRRRKHHAQQLQQQHPNQGSANPKPFTAPYRCAAKIRPSYDNRTIMSCSLIAPHSTAER